uniref:Polygalacturonase n=1 Tax=Aegilops tauschii subsp. strangulata TaxID=200361 RepID=A0A453M6G2_AEGTS
LSVSTANSVQETGSSLKSSTQKNVFVLDNYGARGDGKHDDTQALARAWNAACSSSRPAVLLVPKGKTYLLKAITLSGPCRSSIVFKVKGTLIAPPSMSAWTDNDRRRWIFLQRITGLTVNGGGTINGNGEIWWNNSCKTNKALPCKGAPTALTFHLCNNLKVENLKLVNSQQIHVSVQDCSNVHLARLSITAPGTSPNTDGIHITHSKYVQLYGTTNGARIKTWQGGSGYAKDIVFQNMIMDNVQNPIIIDQNYCDSAKPCKGQNSAVEVRNVAFKNIQGTTISKD